MKHSLRSLNVDRLTEMALFFVLLLSFIYVFPRWADQNQNSRLDMVVAVVEDHTFRIDPYVKNTVDYAMVGDHYYSDKAPGAAFLGIPLYAGLKVFLDTPAIDPFVTRLSNSTAFQSTLRAEGSGVQAQKVRFALAQVVLALVASAFPTALLGVLLFRFTSQFTERLWPPLVVALAYGLLTPAFAYANAFYGHQLSTFLLFAAFFLIWRGRQSLSAGRLFGAGLLLGYSVLTEYPSILIVVLIYLYAVYQLKLQNPWRQVLARISWLTMGGLLLAAVLMVYNTAVFGGPFQLGYDRSTLWQAQHGQGFLSLTFPHLDALWGITFGVFRGLFVLSPILLLAVPGFWLWYCSKQGRPEFWLALGCVIAIFGFNASSDMWWGGFAVGPRYLLPALPFLAVPLVFPFAAWGRQVWFRIIAGALVFWSFVATWGLTLAEQAFPPDTIRNPFLDYALPNWLSGNIARSLGTILGLNGAWSLLPLFGLLFVIGLSWALLIRSQLRTPVVRSELAKQGFEQ